MAGTDEHGKPGACAPAGDESHLLMAQKKLEAAGQCHPNAVATLVEEALDELRCALAIRAKASMAASDAASMPGDAPDPGALREFARTMIRAALDGCGVEGADIQDKAEALGLLRRVERTEACGEDCICAVTEGFPTHCYVMAPGLVAQGGRL